MALDTIATLAKDTLTVRRVYGEPVQQDGLTVIPVASVSGGGGGGGGHGPAGEEGEGGGFGLGARPIGVYVIENGTVRWQPALDVNRLAGLFVTLVAILLLGRRRSSRRKG